MGTRSNRPGWGSVALFWVVLATAGGTVAYFRSAATRFAPADTLDGVYDRYVDALVRLNDQVDALGSPPDVPGRSPAVGPRLMAIANEIDGLAAVAKQLPRLDAPELDRVTAAHRMAEQAQAQRWRAATDRIPAGAVGLNSPLFPALVRVPSAVLNFRSALERTSTDPATVAPHDRPAVTAAPVAPASPPAVATEVPGPNGWPEGHPPASLARGQGWHVPPPPPRPPSIAARFGSDQIVTLHVRGLADRSSQAQGLADHLFRVWPTAHDEEGTDEEDDLNAVVMRFAPVVDVRAAADRIDFGRAVADPAARSITVDVDPAAVARIVNPPRPTPAIAPAPPPELPAVVAAGAKVGVHRGASWAAATVLAREGRRYRVHYDGGPDAGDEWVGRDRMRPAAAN